MRSEYGAANLVYFILVTLLSPGPHSGTQRPQCLALDHEDPLLMQTKGGRFKTACLRK